MEIEEKKREEKRKIDEEKREQRRKEKEKKKLISKRRSIKRKFDRDHAFLVTKTTPEILWLPAKHNISTKKMLQERQSVEFEEPYPEILPYLNELQEQESEGNNNRDSLENSPNERNIDSPEHEFVGNAEKEEKSSENEKKTEMTIEEEEDDDKEEKD